LRTSSGLIQVGTEKSEAKRRAFVDGPATRLPTRVAGQVQPGWTSIFAPNAHLQLGDLHPRSQALMAVDLTQANQALALKGQSLVDVILGADVFDAHEAVIDYGSNSLFLLP
jgi:hypothetical protein